MAFTRALTEDAGQNVESKDLAKKDGLIESN